MGGGVPKQFRSLAGMPLYRWSVQILRAIGGIVVVVPSDDVDRVQSECGGMGEIVVVGGGARRQDSVANGLKALPHNVATVMVHDAARPFVPHSMARRVLGACEATGMAIPVVPVPDTVKRSDDGQWAMETVNRHGLFLAQTPQACRRELLASIVAILSQELTDEAQGAEFLGIRPRMIPGSPFTFKITTEADFAVADAVAHWLRTRRCDEDWHWIRCAPAG